MAQRNCFDHVPEVVRVTFGIGRKRRHVCTELVTCLISYLNAFYCDLWLNLSAKEQYGLVDLSISSSARNSSPFTAVGN